MTVLAARAAMVNPCGLILLGLSLAMAAASAALPGAAPWSGHALWFAACGLAAYLTSVGVVALTFTQRGVETEAIELREVRRVRDRLVDLLRSEQLRGDPTASALVRTLGETVSELDKRVLPALTHLVTRHDSVAATLAQYANGYLPTPDPDVLERVRTVEQRQRAAIVGCVRQAVNAEAAMLAIINDERASGAVADDVRAWAVRLLDMHDALQELLRGGD
jgi:hypothetical protein